VAALMLALEHLSCGITAAPAASTLAKHAHQPGGTEQLCAPLARTAQVRPRPPPGAAGPARGARR
jgi:hypothetical protein